MQLNIHFISSHKYPRLRDAERTGWQNKTKRKAKFFHTIHATSSLHRGNGKELNLSTWQLMATIHAHFSWICQTLQISQEKPCVPQLSSTPFHSAQSVTDGRGLIKFLALSTLELKPCLSRPSYMSFPFFRACQPLVLVPALQVTPASLRELQFGSKEISSLGEAVGIFASLVRHPSALFSSANNILLKNPAYSDLRSGNCFK